MVKTKTLGKDLSDFNLYYEELEKKVKKTVKSKTSVKKVDKTVKPSVKDRFLVKTKHVRTRFNNVVNKVKPQPKKARNITKKQQKLNRQQQIRGILGIGLLFVVVSIAYSSYVIYNGVSSSASRVMLVPQVIFALLTLYKAFSKIYK